MRFLFANDTSKVDHKRLCLRLSSMWKHPKDFILQTVDYTHRNPKRYIGPLEKERARDKRGMSAGTSTLPAPRAVAGAWNCTSCGFGTVTEPAGGCFRGTLTASPCVMGLIRILNDIHPDDVCEEVENLLKENEDGVQIHS
jgi:hypothetical protein